MSMGFPRQEYWSGLPFPSPGDLPNPGIELSSPVLLADSLPLSHLGSPGGPQDSSRMEVDTTKTSHMIRKLEVSVSPPDVPW